MKRFKLRALYSRGALLAFALLYAFFAVIGSTFAWVTSADARANEFSGQDRPEAVLYEVFEPDMDWQPGGGIPQETGAYNSGTVDMLVRITFEESLTTPHPLASFATYNDSAIILPEYCKASSWADASTLFIGGVTLAGSIPAGLVIKAKQLETLAGGSGRYDYAIYYDLGNGKYQRATASLEPRSGDTLAVSNIRYWGYTGYTAPQTAKWRENLPDLALGETRDIRRLVASEMIGIDYNAADFDDTAPAAGKWYYNQEDGYFYYINKLVPGGITPSLLEGFTLAADAPAAYSGLRLDFTVHLESVSCAAAALDEWDLRPGDAVYDALESCGAFTG